jgi:hypothetical protein
MQTTHDLVALLPIALHTIFGLIDYTEAEGAIQKPK